MLLTFDYTVDLCTTRAPRIESARTEVSPTRRGGSWRTGFPVNERREDRICIVMNCLEGPLARS